MRTAPGLRPVYNKAMYTGSLRLAASMLVLACACGDDELGPYGFVGNACRSDLDCAPGVRCERGNNFPDGTCALACRDHYDCPRGTACVDVAGGVCLVSCVDELHCRVGYECRPRDDRVGNAESYVCIR